MSKLLKMVFESPVNDPYILTVEHLACSLVFTIFVGLIMMMVYRYCHDTLTYNKKFNVLLLMLSCITCVLLALIQNNPLLSLGVLGSLSICRIRTNTKDPRDLGFVFWALSIGIASAVGAFLASLLSSVVLALIILAFEFKRKQKHSITMIVRGQKQRLDTVEDVFLKLSRCAIQSKNVFEDHFEVVYEVDQQEIEKKSILEVFNQMDGIHGVNVLACETQIV